MMKVTHVTIKAYTMEELNKRIKNMSNAYEIDSEITEHFRFDRREYYVKMKLKDPTK